MSFQFALLPQGFPASNTNPSAQGFGQDSYNTYQFDSRKLEHYWAQPNYQSQMAQYYSISAATATAAHQTVLPSGPTSLSPPRHSPHTEQKMDLYQTSQGKLMSTSSSASVAAKPARNAAQPTLHSIVPAGNSSAKRPIHTTPDVAAGSATAVLAVTQVQPQQQLVSRKEIVVGKVLVVERQGEVSPARSGTLKSPMQECIGDGSGCDFWLRRKTGTS
ncbi:hypothetical protein HDU93_006416 [Gonapodya sp. JEL0774]|nr:hypothetical protein HDU93_006416 [Gonapodya sp. JEL0774]